MDWNNRRSTLEFPDTAAGYLDYSHIRKGFISHYMKAIMKQLDGNTILRCRCLKQDTVSCSRIPSAAAGWGEHK